jgi:radical SAM protein with 4Fe4S-binding SPASM domain
MAHLPYLATRLTPLRLWNALLVLISYYRARWTSQSNPWGMPITISVEPTTACNLRCPECPSGLRAFTRPTGNLDADFFRQMVDAVYKRTICLIFYFQGEPYINPDFLNMVQYARKKGLFTMTSTNGHFLDDARARRTVESGLDQLIVSLDGATQETYAQYRIGGNLQSALDGAKRVADWKRRLGKKSPEIVFQCLVLKTNEHELDDIRRLARQYGANRVQFKSAQVYHYENGHPLIPNNTRYARYRQNPDGRWTPKHALLNHCWKMWHACVVTWNGTVVPCCFDKDAAYPLGNLRTADFHSIWYGPAYQNFRKTLRRGRQHIPICTNCSEGCRVIEPG